MASSGSPSPVPEASTSPKSPVTPPRGAKRSEKTVEIGDSGSKADQDEESRLRARLLAKLEKGQQSVSGKTVSVMSEKSSKRTVHLLDEDTTTTATHITSLVAVSEDLGEIGPGIRPPQMSAPGAKASKYEPITVTVGGAKDKSHHEIGAKRKDKSSYKNQPSTSSVPKRPTEHQLEKKDSKKSRPTHSPITFSLNKPSNTVVPGNELSDTRVNTKQKKIDAGWRNWKAGKEPIVPENEGKVFERKDKRREGDFRKEGKSERVKPKGKHGRMEGAEKPSQRSHSPHSAYNRHLKSAKSHVSTHSTHRDRTRDGKSGRAHRDGKSKDRSVSRSTDVPKETIAPIPLRSVKPMEGGIFGTDPQKSESKSKRKSSESGQNEKKKFDPDDGDATPVLDEPTFGDSDGSENEPMEDGERHDSASPNERKSSSAVQSKSKTRNPKPVPRWNAPQTKSKWIESSPDEINDDFVLSEKSDDEGASLIGTGNQSEPESSQNG